MLIFIFFYDFKCFLQQEVIKYTLPSPPPQKKKKSWYLCFCEMKLSDLCTSIFTSAGNAGCKKKLCNTHGNHCEYVESLS